MKKQLLLLLLTAGCIPAVIEETKKDEKKGVQITEETTKAQVAPLVCKNCRRK